MEQEEEDDEETEEEKDEEEVEVLNMCSPTGLGGRRMLVQFSNNASVTCCCPRAFGSSIHLQERAPYRPANRKATI